jgi:hypothetical protein
MVGAHSRGDGMEQNGRRNSRRSVALLALAALLIVGGLMSAISAPGAPPRSNKADAYGGPTPTKPTNPKNRKACDDYYGGPQNKLAEPRECRSKADRNVGLKKCKKKSGAARSKCEKAVKKRYAKEHAANVKQQKAEDACAKKYNEGFQQLNPDDPNYSQKGDQLGAEHTACMRKAMAR